MGCYHSLLPWRQRRFSFFVFFTGDLREWDVELYAASYVLDYYIVSCKIKGMRRPQRVMALPLPWKQDCTMLPIRAEALSGTLMGLRFLGGQVCNQELQMMESMRIDLPHSPKPPASEIWREERGGDGERDGRRWLLMRAILSPSPPLHLFSVLFWDADMKGPLRRALRAPAGFWCRSPLRSNQPRSVSSPRVERAL